MEEMCLPMGMLMMKWGAGSYHDVDEEEAEAAIGTRAAKMMMIMLTPEDRQGGEGSPTHRWCVLPTTPPKPQVN